MTAPLAYPSNYNELRITVYEKVKHNTYIFFINKEDTLNDKRFVGGFYYKTTDRLFFLLLFECSSKNRINENKDIE